MRLIDADELMARLRNDPLFAVIEPYNIEGVIAAAPTIKAVPVRRGRWELIDDIEPTAYRCSICNKVSTCKWGYCPYCGSKMEELE